jgi:hypothetical protein
MKRHGLSRTPEYRAFYDMHKRCRPGSVVDRERYAERGIKVCQGWHDIEVFVAAIGKKPSPKHSLDRRDNNGNYSCGQCEECKANGWPTNVYWATPEEQRNNQERCHYITINGVTKTRVQWRKENGLDEVTVYYRLKMGWSEQDAVTIPSGMRMKGRPVLSRADRQKIARRLRSGEPATIIAKDFNTSQTTVLKIKKANA